MFRFFLPSYASPSEHVRFILRGEPFFANPVCGSYLKSQQVQFLCSSRPCARAPAPLSFTSQLRFGTVGPFSLSLPRCASARNGRTSLPASPNFLLLLLLLSFRRCHLRLLLFQPPEHSEKSLGGCARMGKKRKGGRGTAEEKRFR